MTLGIWNAALTDGQTQTAMTGGVEAAVAGGGNSEPSDEAGISSGPMA